MQGILVWVIVGGAAFFNNFLFEGISWADFLILLASLIIFTGMLRQKNPTFFFPRNGVNLLVLWGWIILGYIVLAHTRSFPMDDLEFMKSFAKYTFYSSTYLLIYSFFVSTGKTKLQRIILNVLVLNGLLAIYIYLAMSTSLGLPYKFFWVGQKVTEATAYYHDTGFVRARGIFTEPAVFGLYQAMGLAFILLPNSRIDKKMLWKLTVIVLSLILTVSLVAYCLLGVVICLYLLKNLSIKQPDKATVLALVLVMAIGLGLWLTPLGGFIQEGIVTRLTYVAQGDDNSAIERLLGSWEFPISVVRLSPVFGSGLGNLDTFYPVVSSTLQYKPFDNANITNILAYILGALGPIGLALFLPLLIGLMANNLSLGLVFLLAMFATGYFLDSPFWLFLSLYNLPVHGENHWIWQFSRERRVG